MVGQTELCDLKQNHDFGLLPLLVVLGVQAKCLKHGSHDELVSLQNFGQVRKDVNQDLGDLFSLFKDGTDEEKYVVVEVDVFCDFLEQGQRDRLYLI